MNVEEVPIVPNYYQGDFAILYIPNRDTVYITGSANHSQLAGVVNLDPHYPHFFGEVNDTEVKIYPDSLQDSITDETRAQLEVALWKYIGRDSTFLDKVSNIYDPIEKELDRHAFQNGKPRQSVVDFITRLYARALKAEYGIENIDMWVDLYVTGSLTTFQFSETSDCDVSVFPNYERFAQSFGENSSQTRKRLVSLSIEHIDGTFLPGTAHPLQFFVVADGIERTDLYQPGLRSAWSIFDEMWVVKPERERSREVASEFPDAYSRAASMAQKMADALDHDSEQARELWKQVHKKRQLDQMAGLGDYSEGNIVYKWLLHEGLFDRIKNELGEYIATSQFPIPQQVQDRLLKQNLCPVCQSNLWREGDKIWCPNCTFETTIKRAVNEWTLIPLTDEQVNAWDKGRGEYGYPVIADPSTHRAFIGPLDSHHSDVLYALQQMEPERKWFSGGIWSINCWPPGEYDPNEWYVDRYGQEQGDEILNEQLREWCKKQV